MLPGKFRRRITVFSLIDLRVGWGSSLYLDLALNQSVIATSSHISLLHTLWLKLLVGKIKPLVGKIKPSRSPSYSLLLQLHRIAPTLILTNNSRLAITSFNKNDGKYEIFISLWVFGLHSWWFFPFLTVNFYFFTLNWSAWMFNWILNLLLLEFHPGLVLHYYYFLSYGRFWSNNCWGPKI